MMWCSFVKLNFSITVICASTIINILFKWKRPNRYALRRQTSNGRNTKCMQLTWCYLLWLPNSYLKFFFFFLYVSHECTNLWFLKHISHLQSPYSFVSSFTLSTSIRTFYFGTTHLVFFFKHYLDGHKLSLVIWTW